jgi:type VI protein secretion system component Hcp
MTMKRTLLTGAAIAIALAAAIPLWLALDDDERRAAALQEPMGTGDVGRLILTGKNGGNPFPVRSYGVSAQYSPATQTARSDVVYRGELLRRIDNASVSSFALGSTDTDAAGKLEIGATKPYLLYTLAHAAVDSLSQGGRGETLQLFLDTLTAELSGAAPVAPAAEVVGRMTVPGLSSNSFPITGFDSGFQREVHRRTDGTLSFGSRQHRLVTVRRAIDALAPAMFSKIQAQISDSTKVGEFLGNITVELITPGTTTPYATYAFANVVLAKVEDGGAAGTYPTQTIEFSYDRVELKTASGSASDGSAAPK